MRLDLHLHLAEDREATRKLDTILHLLKEILSLERHMTLELDNLTLEVQENTDVVESAIALISGIAAQLAAIKDDPAKIQALADTLDATSAKLAAAVVANTPIVPEV
jgi:septum formation topological specificity factor MinE